MKPLADKAKNLRSFFWCCSPKTRRKLKLPSTASRSVADRAPRSAVEILSRDSQAPEYELNCYEEWGKLLGDVPTAGAILDRLLHHAQTIAIAGRSYRLKDQTPAKDEKAPNKTTGEPSHD